MKRIIALILGSVFITSSAWAEYYEREGSYVYKVTPYTELWSTADGVKVTAKLAHKVLLSVLETMHAKRMLPDAVLSQSDLEKFRKAQNDVDSLVDYLNEFVREQRARGGKLEGVDLLPDAIMFFGGHKFSLNFGKGAGVSGSVGLILMPVWVEKFNVNTGKLVQEGVSMRSSMVVMPAADAGFGIGGGARNRVGIGLIWDMNDSFTNPAQFWGAGVGVSWSPVVVGAGVNVKVGALSNWEMPGWIDFTYASVALEVGAVAEIGTPRINLSTVISGPAFMGLFDRAQEQGFKDMMKENNKKMEEFLREIGPQLPPKRGSSKGGEEAGIDDPNGNTENRRR